MYAIKKVSHIVIFELQIIEKKKVQYVHLMPQHNATTFFSIKFHSRSKISKISGIPQIVTNFESSSANRAHYLFELNAQ